MKTTSLLILLAGIGTWLAEPAFAEPSTEAAPKAASQPVKASQEAPRRDFAKKPDDHGSNKKEDTGKEEHKELSHSVGKAEAKAAGTASPSPRALDAHRHAIVQRQIKRARENQPHYGEQSMGNRQARSGLANTGPQHTLAFGKSAGAGEGRPVVLKSASKSTKPAAASAASLPTSPGPKMVDGRSPALATIGGPAKISSPHNTALSGSTMKLRP